MHRTPAIQVKAIVLAPLMAATMQNVAGQLASTSRKIYTIDTKHFAQWKADRYLSLFSFGRDELAAYRIWTVARRLLDETVQCSLLAHNPAEGIRGFKTGDDESPHHALKREGAKTLLDAIDCSTALGKRDYTLLMLLLRIGIRCAEVVVLTLGDLVMEQGYHVAIILHGKGNKRSLAKLPVKVCQAIDNCLEAVGRACAPSEAPLFVSFPKDDHPQERPLYANHVERIVKQSTQAAGIVMSPHGMRASFITLAFESERISRWYNMERGIKIQGPRGGIKSDEITYIKMMLTLSSSKKGQDTWMDSLLRYPLLKRGKNERDVQC